MGRGGGLSRELREVRQRPSPPQCCDKQEALQTLPVPPTATRRVDTPPPPHASFPGALPHSSVRGPSKIRERLSRAYSHELNTWGHKVTSGLLVPRRLERSSLADVVKSSHVAFLASLRTLTNLSGFFLNCCKDSLVGQAKTGQEATQQATSLWWPESVTAGPQGVSGAQITLGSSLR